MSLGAVRSLRTCYPDARLSVLVRPWVRELYEACDVVDDTVLYDPRHGDRGMAGFLRAARRVREHRFDACVILPNAFRAAAFIKAAGIPERWGYATESRSILLTKRVPQPPRPFGRHQAYFYLDLLSGLGLDVGRRSPDTTLVATTAMTASAEALLESAGWTGGPLIGVHPGATNSRAKIWSASRYAEVAREMAAREDAQIVVLGGEAEAALAAEVLSGLPDGSKLSLHGRTSLGELMGVLTKLCVFLTNDSGPMHLASALGVSTVAVFGPTDSRETGPLGEHARVVREAVDCSPCAYRDCPIDHRCMERVSVDRVVGEAAALLAASS